MVSLLSGCFDNAIFSSVNVWLVPTSHSTVVNGDPVIDGQAREARVFGLSRVGMGSNGAATYGNEPRQVNDIGRLSWFTLKF